MRQMLSLFTMKPRQRICRRRFINKSRPVSREATSSNSTLDGCHQPTLINRPHIPNWSLRRRTLCAWILTSLSLLQLNWYLRIAVFRSKQPLMRALLLRGVCYSGWRNEWFTNGLYVDERVLVVASAADLLAAHSIGLYSFCDCHESALMTWEPREHEQARTISLASMSAGVLGWLQTPEEVNEDRL